MAEVRMPETTKTEKKKPPERKEMKPIVNHDNVIRRKKPLSQKIAGKIIAEDLNDVKEYVVNDLIIPGLIDTFLDTICMIFGREGGFHSDRDRGRSGNTYYNYSGHSSYRGRSRSSRSSSRSTRRRRDEDGDLPDYDNVIITDRRDAEDLVDRLHEIIRDDGEVSIAQFFELLDLTAPYTDNKWGWTRKNQIGIKKVKGGFLIDVDEAKYLG